MKKKTSKSISQLSHALNIGNSVISISQLSQIKGGLIILDDIGGM